MQRVGRTSARQREVEADMGGVCDVNLFEIECLLTAQLATTQIPVGHGKWERAIMRMKVKEQNRGYITRQQAFTTPSLPTRHFPFSFTRAFDRLGVALWVVVLLAARFRLPPCGLLLDAGVDDLVGCTRVSGR